MTRNRDVLLHQSICPVHGPVSETFEADFPSGVKTCCSSCYPKYVAVKAGRC